MGSTKPMIEERNITEITHFILLGFSDFPRITVVLFVVFLLIYITTLTWNLSLIILIRLDSHLHTPMYFFLSNLSIIDICYVTSTAPKMLSNFFQEQQTITLVGCAVQYFIFSTMGLSESCLMTAMAYDRYAAICNPLLYSSIMSPTLCVQMVLGSYMAGLSASISQLCAMLQLQFCGPNVINHFFCDMPQLLVLSCTDTFFVQLMTAVLIVIFGIINVSIIMISYGYIVISIMKITSAKGRSKAFSTCASHLTAVTLFYSSSIFVYLSSSSGGSSSFDRFASVFYTVVIPMLNPLIYSLRNKEIKDALKRLQKKGNSARWNLQPEEAGTTAEPVTQPLVAGTLMPAPPAVGPVYKSPGTQGSTSDNDTHGPSTPGCSATSTPRQPGNSNTGGTQDSSIQACGKSVREMRSRLPEPKQLKLYPNKKT
nr:PREDICTED: olfactory receptor 5AN1-like [Equus przewalskii]